METLARDNDTDIPDLVNIIENKKLWKILVDSHLDRSRRIKVFLYIIALGIYFDISRSLKLERAIAP